MSAELPRLLLLCLPCLALCLFLGRLARTPALSTQISHPTSGAMPLGVCGQPSHQQFTMDNLAAHTVPHWFEDAKLGIFIHWGLYSVPGWAVINHTHGDKVDQHTKVTLNPYAEWYMNTMQLEGSPTQKYHKKVYGNLPYLGFIPMFNKAIKAWKPKGWATLFRQAGAKYVVLTTKHHDGFTLWPSDVQNPHRKAEEQHVSRDVVGELTHAVRGEGLEMGLYYSGGLDWSFEGKLDKDQLRPLPPNTEEYGAYCDAHLRELMQKYRPAVLWDDITYPSPSKPQRLREIFIEYFNTYCPEGVVNKRWQLPEDGFTGDFATPEYRRQNVVHKQKWEMCRGIGRSFGYNRNEGPKEMLTGPALIRLLVDVTAKNGNLLLDVGPDAEGQISELQQRPLRELGDWLVINGQAIYGTRPFLSADTTINSSLRYTSGHGYVYCIVLDVPATHHKNWLVLPLQVQPGVNLSLLSSPGSLRWGPATQNGGIGVDLPQPPPSPPFVIAISHPRAPLDEAVTVLRP